MQNLYSKLHRIQREKNEKWEGEKVGYMLDMSWFIGLEILLYQHE